MIILFLYIGSSRKRNKQDCDGWFSHPETNICHHHKYSETEGKLCLISNNLYKMSLLIENVTLPLKKFQNVSRLAWVRHLSHYFRKKKRESDDVITCLVFRIGIPIEKTLEKLRRHFEIEIWKTQEVMRS